MRNIFLFIVVLTALCTVSCQAERTNKASGIVVLSPEVAEIICALGAEHDIVAITEECNYPASLSAKQKVGSFSAIDREAIIALKPALVLCSSLEQEMMATELGKLGIKVEVVYPGSLEGLFGAISKIGMLIDRKTEASKLVQNMKREVELIRQSSLGKPRPKVYLEIYRNPLMSVSDSSFVGELIETAGGDNIFSSLERDYARVNPEAVIKARPDIIICYSQDSQEGILARKGWQDIPALKTRNIYFENDLNPDLMQRATPRSLEGMKQLRQMFDLWQARQ